MSAAKVNLDYTNIISPVDGTVVSRNVTQGQTVAASFQTPTLFLIATDLTQMQVDTNVSESDIGNVAVGNKVLFTVEAYPDRDVHRHRHAGAAGAAERAERHHLRRRRRRAESEAAVETRHDRGGARRNGGAQRTCCACRIRRCAIRRRAGERCGEPQHRNQQGAERTQHAVWRLEDGRPVRVPIEIGLDDDAFTEVIGGALTEGDTIIVGVAGAHPGGARRRSGGTGTPRMPRF